MLFHLFHKQFQRKAALNYPPGKLICVTNCLLLLPPSWQSSSKRREAALHIRILLLNSNISIYEWQPKAVTKIEEKRI